MEGVRESDGRHFIADVYRRLQRWLVVVTIGEANTEDMGGWVYIIGGHPLVRWYCPDHHKK